MLVDYVTAKITKVAPITGGEGLSAARLQIAAMAGVKSSLKEIVEKAVVQNGDFRAVGVVPSVMDGHSTASVLLDGAEFKTLVLPLE